MLIRDIISPRKKKTETKEIKIKKQSQIPKKLLAIFVVLILVSQIFTGLNYFQTKQAKAAGTTYYVDNSCPNNGDGSCNGTSPSCTCASGSGQPGPFNSITNMQAKAGGYSGDDNIYLKKGETFREQLTVPSSGTSGHPITFGAYGDGDLPVVSANNLLSAGSWSKTGGQTNVYQIALTTNPGSLVLENGVALAKQTSIANVDANTGSFYWISNVLYVQASDSSNPGTNGKSYGTSIRTYAVDINAKTYTTLTYLNMQGGTTAVIRLNSAHNTTITLCTIKNAPGIVLRIPDASESNTVTFTNNDISVYWGAGLYVNGDDYIITGNNFHDAKGGQSIYTLDLVGNHPQNVKIWNNTFSNIGVSGSGNDPGIMPKADVNGTNSDFPTLDIRYNIFKNLYGRAIDGFFGNSTIAYNVIYNIYNGAANSAIGIEVNGKNNNIYNNVLYNTQNIGIMVGTDPVAGDVANVLKNNIVYSTSINHIVYVTTGAISPTMNNNIFWMGGNGGQTSYWWKGTDYTFTDWKTQSGGDAHSLETNPLFISTSTPDFHLQSGSPAIDAGTNVGLTSDYDGVSVPRGAGYEIGAYEYPVPLAPTIGSPSALSFSSIRWNFTDNSNDETGFRLYGSTGAVLTQSPLTNLLYLDETGLSANTSYSGRYVKAYNSYGESAASGIASSITTPNAPGSGGPMGFMGTSPATANLSLPATPAQTAPPTAPSPAPSSQPSFPTTPITTPIFTQTLKYGFNNKQVTLLQDTLKQLGFFPQSIRSNGNFGPTTRQSVKRFQCQYSIVCSGNERTTGYGQVGPKTRQALNQLNH